MTMREGVLLRGSGAERATPYREQGPVQHRIPEQQSAPAQEHPQVEERRSTIRRAADLPVVGGGASFRLGDVYAEELERLREHARAEGFAVGHAEGMQAPEPHSFSTYVDVLFLDPSLRLRSTSR